MNARVKRLESELRSVQEALQEAIDSLKDAHGEFWSKDETLAAVTRRLRSRVETLARVAEGAKGRAGAAAEAVLEVDRDLRVTDLNPAAEQLVRRERQEAAGQPLLDVLPHLKHSALRDALVQALKGQDGSVETRELLPERLMLASFEATDDGARVILRDATEDGTPEARQKAVHAETQHRVKNILSSVRMLARQTEENSTSLSEFSEAFQSRLDAVGLAQVLLSRSKRAEVALEELVSDTLLLYERADPVEVSIDGPPVFLQERSAQTMAVAINELAANATKHGAFAARPAGRLEVKWSVDEDDDVPILTFSWKERGLKLQTTPTKVGFGRKLIEEAVVYELDADVALEFEPDGLSCAFKIPLKPEIGSFAHHA